MQWFKSAMVVSSAVFVAAMAANGCSNSNPSGGDSGKDTGVTPTDSGKKDVATNPDGGGGCTSGTTCEVCDVSGYTAPSMGKPVQVLNACNATQLQGFVTACFSSTATSQTCTAFSATDSGACGTCLAPVLQSTANWGPFDCATSSSPCGANSGGCVDLVLKTQSTEKGQGGAGSCGDLVTSNFGCQDYACGTCTGTDFTTCDQAAITAECKTYADAATSATGACAPINGDAEPAGIASCFPQSDADNVNFLNIFCGTGTSP